ncbi:DUF126 domain-containing protein [candidate division KSB1 bacterium]|nr:DUF126 domain-containing protein [candidate division KSB1 bacterium]
MEVLTGRIIYAGKATGRVLASDKPIGFFGHVDPETGIIKDKEHPLLGESISGRVLVFPHAKGSTVGSYILYSLRKKNTAPAAIIIGECELIVAVGAIIAEIPTIDQIDISQLQTDDYVEIDGDTIRRA